MHSENCKGTRIDPCETPQVTLTFIDSDSSRETVPDSPTLFLRRFIKILWSTVSKTAVKSKGIKSVKYLASAVSCKTLTTLFRAVSVLSSDRNPDLNFEKVRCPLEIVQVILNQSFKKLHQKREV